MKSPTGRYTYRQEVMAIPTRCRVEDAFCTASHRSTTTNRELLTDKPYLETTTLAVCIAITVFDEILGKKKDQVLTKQQ